MSNRLFRYFYDNQFLTLDSGSVILFIILCLIAHSNSDLFQSNLLLRGCPPAVAYSLYIKVIFSILNYLNTVSEEFLKFKNSASMKSIKQRSKRLYRLQTLIMEAAIGIFHLS